MAHQQVQRQDQHDRKAKHARRRAVRTAGPVGQDIQHLLGIFRGPVVKAEGDGGLHAGIHRLRALGQRQGAENGQRAVEMFKNSEAGRFSAILMDMRMPVMDGLTATREIRRLGRPDAATIPIIALTANAFEEDVKQCIQAGMDAHLSKPVDIDRLKALLGSMLSDRI